MLKEKCVSRVGCREWNKSMYPVRSGEGGNAYLRMSVLKWDEASCGGYCEGESESWGGYMEGCKCALL